MINYKLKYQFYHLIYQMNLLNRIKYLFNSINKNNIPIIPIMF